jgi:apolipoprotein N-acyltransferase
MKFQQLPLKLLGDVIALIAGALLPLAFAPFRFYLLAIFSTALLLITWLPATPKRAFLRGWLFGVGMYGVGVYWVYISLHVYGYSSPFFAGLTTALLIILFAFYPAVQGYLLNRIFPANSLSKCILAFPASWVLLEWIRTWLFTGFPWLLIGYSQINSPLRGLAPIFGVYGVSFAVVFTSAAFVAIFYFKNTRWRVTLIILIVLIWIISGLLTKIHWTQPQDGKIKVSLVQGNIPQELKWQSSQIQNILNTYPLLTEQHWDSDIIIWPEAAIVITNVDAKPYLDQIDSLAKKHNVAIITGIPIYKDSKFYNGIIVLGKGSGTYLKHHLLPYGDYIPFRSFINLFDKYVQIPMSGFSHGPKFQPNLIAHGINIAPFICYEIVFPAEVRRSLPQAQLLVLVTDDSWFGRSIASAQHLEMGQMRSLETGRYLLFTSNTGITAVIDPQGKLQAIAPTFTPYVLTSQVQAMNGATPFVLWGSYPVLIGSLLLLIFAAIYRRH